MSHDEPVQENRDVVFRCLVACAVPFKGVVEALINCHVTDINLVINSKGVCITHVDSALSMVIRIFLEQPSFQLWELNNNNKNATSEDLVVGLNAAALQKITKGLTSRDTLEMAIYKDSDMIYLRVYNDFSQSLLEHKMKTLLLDHDKITIPQREFTRTVTMPTSDFARHVRDLASVGGKFVTISADSDKLVLGTKTDYCESSAIVKAKKKKQGTGSVTIGLGRREGPSVVEGAEYSIKYLQCIAKSSLDDTLTLFLSAAEEGNVHQPLLARYTISVLGSIVFFLAPEN